ncbi:MAG: ATPase domain-containing protein [archaeon]|nr:ATPase domain-containing protein [archaeon]
MRSSDSAGLASPHLTSQAADVDLESFLNPEIRTILVKGEPGTGKTLLGLELLRRYGRGVYLSSRVSEQGIFDHYPELKTLFRRGRIKVAGPKAASAKFEDVRLADTATMLESIVGVISKSKEPLVIVDSWDTVAKELDKVERMKTEKALVTIADTHRARLVFISEEPASTSTDYAVDAVVTLKDEVHAGRRVRRIEWNKLRGSDIPQKLHLFSLHDAKFNIFHPTKTNLVQRYKPRQFQGIKNSRDLYSTGSKDLDALLGGGMKKGTRMLLELGKYLGSDWHLPLITSISCNFLLNGGCDALIPTSGLIPESVKESRSPYLPKEIVETSVRIGHFGETSSDDPCFFKLDPGSMSKTYETFFKEVERIRVRPGDVSGTRRPCLFGVGVDKLEAIFGDEVLAPYYQRGAAITRQGGDAGILIAKHSTKSTDKLADLVDIYLKLDDIDGALVIYALKPPSRIYHVEYDYSRGYPNVQLTPVA